MENVNKGSWKVSKHADFGQKTFSMNGDFFMILTQQKSLLIFLNEYFIKDLVHMSSSFVLQITKKDGILYLLTNFFFIFSIYFSFIIFAKKI